MARITIKPESIQGAACVLIQRKAGGFYVLAKAHPYGKRGKLFGLVVNDAGAPVMVNTADDAKKLGCGKVAIPKRQGVRKLKFGNRELEYLGLYEMAEAAKMKAKKRGGQGKIGFMKAKTVAKFYAGLTRIGKR